MTDDKEKLKQEVFLTQFQDVEHLVNWVDEFFGIKLPLGHIDPESNSSPAEWMYEAYSTYRDNKGDIKPGFVVMSSRDSYKTLTESMLAVILMLHFKATIAHLAAIESQASKAIQYVTQFIKKIEPYAVGAGLSIDSQSKRKVAILDPATQRVSYVNVIVATLQGTNSEHTNVLSIDEVDVMRFVQAYDEAKFIPGVMMGQHPITIATSTRKFAFGLMEKEWSEAEKSGFTKLRWNILDVTERCPNSRHKPDEKKVTRYIHPRLPLRNISKAELADVSTEKQGEYIEIKAHKGCENCILLPVCRMRLASRPEADVGNLFKPISFVINQFKKTSPDLAEAQLLCWKPSQMGLVYGRFDDDGNIYSVAQAFEKFTGAKPPKEVTLTDLIAAMKVAGIKFYAGVDWGFRHAFAISISALVNGEWWIVDTHAVPGLEFEQMMELAKTVRDMYKPVMWYADTSQPMFIKAFRKNKMPCKKFVKDVMGGIEAVRGRIVDGTGRRHLRVIRHDRNEFLIDGFHKHHFKLDAAGVPTLEPDDEQYADVMDEIRYMAQNLFDTKGGLIAPNKTPDQRPAAMTQPTDSNVVYKDWMAQKIQNLATGGSGETLIRSKSGTFIADFGGEDET